MKNWKLIIIIFFCLYTKACFNDVEGLEQENVNYYRVDADTLNDSTIAIINWKDSLHGFYFKTHNNDTVESALVHIIDDYLEYNFIDENNHILRITNSVFLGGKYTLIETIAFDNQGKIDENKSDYLKVEVLKDSIKIILPNLYNKMILVTGDEKTFDSSRWEKSDTLASLTNYIMVPKKYGKRRCFLRAVTMDKGGNDMSGCDYYLDINNLLCRDITKSLICSIN